MPKPKMPRTLTSLDSCRTSGFSMCSAECSLCVVMVHLLLLHQFGPQMVAQREQRPCFQVIEEESYPQAAHGDRHQQIHYQGHPRVVLAMGIEVGLDVPEQIHVAHDKQPHLHYEQLAAIAFQVA